MTNGKAAAAIEFSRAEDADRRVAGIAAAARILHEISASGIERVRLSVPGGALAAATMSDIRRLCPDLAIELVDGAIVGASPARPVSAREILQATAKPSDGLVSRWLNRPLSQRISALLLHIPGIRPIHATIGTALLAAAMVAALLSGTADGLIAGGLLFHAASVFDGVDGEIARATFRTSRLGALLDSVIDMATNALFIIGVTVNLAGRNPWAAPVGAWGILLFIIGLAVIGRIARHDRLFSMDMVKQRYRTRFPSPAGRRTIRFLTTVTSRDFFALLFALLILAGLPMAVLYIFAAAATIWIWFVIGAVISSVRAAPAERSA